MNKTQKSIFHLSLGVIFAYWIYDIFKLTRPAPIIPEDTGALFLKIAILKISVFGVIYLLLRGQGDGWKHLGWRNEKWKGQVLRGAAFGAVMFGLTIAVLDPIINSLLPSNDTGPGIMLHFANMSLLPVWLLSGILGGGFVEELQRVFILTRFEKWKGKGIIPLIVMIDVVSFGIGHLYQGPAGAVSAGLSGLIFALVYLRKRSFIEAFTCHAIYDVIGITVGHILMQQAMSTTP